MKALNTVRALSFLVATAVLAILLWPAAARSDTPGRLFYEIIVTDSGSRSQGWHGVLYDSAGSPIVAAPGQTVPTSVGEFLNVPCENPWDACGMIRTDMADWMKVNQANTQIDTQPWSYRLYVYALGSKSESWTGVLLHGGAEMYLGSTIVDTPMGPFSPSGLSNIGWHSTGWTPAGWQPTNTTSAPHR